MPQWSTLIIQLIQTKHSLQSFSISVLTQLEEPKRFWFESKLLEKVPNIHFLGLAGVTLVNFVQKNQHHSELVLLQMHVYETWW